MAEPAPVPAASPVYDPLRDLAAVLHGAMRQGYHQPAARAAIARLRDKLGLDDHALASDIEAALRNRQGTARRAAALENVRYLASLTEEQLREALIFFRYEQPEKAERLRELLLAPVQVPPAT